MMTGYSFAVLKLVADHKRSPPESYARYCSHNSSHTVAVLQLANGDHHRDLQELLQVMAAE